jgi:hypothetical protein
MRLKLIGYRCLRNETLKLSLMPPSRVKSGTRVWLQGDAAASTLPRKGA